MQHVKTDCSDVNVDLDVGGRDGCGNQDGCKDGSVHFDIGEEKYVVRPGSSLRQNANEPTDA